MKAKATVANGCKVWVCGQAGYSKRDCQKQNGIEKDNTVVSNSVMTVGAPHVIPISLVVKRSILVEKSAGERQKASASSLGYKQARCIGRLAFNDDRGPAHSGTRQMSVFYWQANKT